MPARTTATIHSSIFPDIRKHFYHTAPPMERVHEGHSVQMPCVPPDSEPKAELLWWKDGARVHASGPDSNLIVANDGSLIISAARLMDAGNYSCEARNVAQSRWTDGTRLEVYGEWLWAF